MGELLKCAGGTNGSSNGKDVKGVESQGERVGCLLEREALDWVRYGTVFLRGHHVPKNGDKKQHAFVVSTNDSRVIFDNI